MRKVLATIMLASAAFAFACGSSSSNTALCKDSCAKTNECFMMTADCDQLCSGGSSSGGSSCKNEGAIRSHLQGCINGSCDDYSNCLLEAPSCEQ